MADAKKGAAPASAQDSAGENAQEKRVRVRYIRKHFKAGETHPTNIGHVEELPESEAKALATYEIIEFLPSTEGYSGRLPEKEVLVRIEQLMPGADSGNKEAIAELESIRDAELAGGQVRSRVIKALRSARVSGLPEETE